MEQEENVPEIENETRRLAVVNMDWNQVKVSFSLNLFAFCPIKIAETYLAREL